MSGSEVQIVFTADVSEVIEGVTLIKMALNALVPTIEQVKEDFRELGDAISESLKEAASEGAAEVKNKLSSLTPAAEELKESFAELGKAIHTSLAQGATEGVGQAKTELGELGPAAEQAKSHLSEAGKEGGGALGKIGEAFGGFGEVASKAMEIGSKIREWTVGFAEASEHVQRTANQFGLSTEMVQKLNTVSTATGVKLDSLAGGMDSLNQHLKKGDKSEVFKQLGIDIKGATDSWKVMGQVADSLKNIDDPEKKAKIATELFGASTKDLATVLSMSSTALGEMTHKGEEYQASGTAISANAQKNGEAMAEGINEGKIAWQGINNVLADAFGPTLIEIIESINRVTKAFIDSYAQGGIVKTLFEDVKIVVEEVGAVINALIDVFVELWNSVSEVVTDIVQSVASGIGVTLPDKFKLAEIGINLFKDAFTVAKDLIIIAIEIIRGAVIGLIDILSTLGKVAQDALTLQWGKIESDWNAGMARLQQHASATGAKIKTTWQDALATGAAALSGKTPGEKKPEPPAQKGRGFAITGDGKQATTAPAAAGGQMGGAHTGRGSSAPHTVASHATKPGGESASLLDQWKQDLESERLASENWGRDEAKATLKFWQDKLATNQAKGKELAQVRQEIAKAAYEVGKEEQQDTLAGIQHTLAMKSEAAKQEIELTREGLQDKLQAVDDEQKAGQISTTEAISQRKALNAELYQLDHKAEEKEYDAKREALEAQLKIIGLPVAQQKAINRQLEELKQQHDDKIIIIDRQTNKKLADDAKKAAADQKNPLQQAYAALAQSWSQNIAKMLTMQQSFRDTVHNIYMSLVGLVEKAIGNMVKNWILGLLEQDAASKASHAKQIVLDAKAAASGAWKSAMHTLPPPLNLIMAPIMAATAFAGVMAYSAESGWDVPGGAGTGIDGRGGRLGVIHPHEMVLPATLANPMRDMFGSRAANGNSPIAANDGAASDFHYHDHTGTANPRQIFANRQALAQALVRAEQEGAFKGTKFSFRA